MFLIFILAFLHHAICLKCVVNETKPARFDASPTCEGDTCWLFYDPWLQQYARDCMTGIAREPGCRRAVVDRKDNMYLCYCNHSTKCNTEFPVFHDKNQTVTWAGKNLPNTDVFPQKVTCGTEVFQHEHTVPANLASTIDWLNVTTAAITTNDAASCCITGYINMPRDVNLTATFRADLLIQARLENLFALDPALWEADFPIVFLGSLYAIQFFPYRQVLQKFCREERCNRLNSIDALLVDEVTCQMKVFGDVPPDTCKGQACIARYHYKSGTYESGCFWQDWTTGEARIDVGFYATTSKSGFYICAEDMCNVNETTAMASIKSCRPNYPPFKGKDAETWSDVEEALQTGNYSLNCNPAGTSITSAPTGKITSRMSFSWLFLCVVLRCCFQ